MSRNCSSSLSPLALASITVLDFTRNIGGAYCTKILADLGATVVLLEDGETGHPLRQRGPFLNNIQDPGKSGMFLYLGANKYSVPVDLKAADDLEKVHRMVQQVDLVVEDFPPGGAESLGLDFKGARRNNTKLVVASISHFGQTGPYSQWQGEEIVDYAMGGYMYFGGHPEREPLMVTNNQPQLNAGAQAALASLAAIWGARQSGRGQDIDISTIEAMLSAHSWTSSSWSHEGIVVRRTLPDCIPCKDGWVFFMDLRWDPNIFLLVGQPDLMEDPRFHDRQAWVDNREALRWILVDWCKDHTKREIFHSGQELRIPVTPVYNAEDLVHAPELKAREWLLEMEQSTGVKYKMPGFPYKFSGTPPRIRHGAPSLGQDKELRLIKRTIPRVADTINRRHVPLERRSKSSLSLPLEGIRILEITANWAGPLAGRYLADLGAEVIKVESPERPMTRGGHYAGAQPLRYHYNRSAYFNKMNRNKYGIGLNVATSKGKELFLRLVEEADVVLENNSPRVMRNLKLEYPALKEVNPGIVMVSISGFGQTGPARDYVAYGANIEASSGLASITGYPDDDRPYRTTLFYADPVTAMHAAIAIQAALFQRLLTGEGQFIDISLHENGITFLPEAILEYTISGKIAQRRGNRHAVYAPQGCYPSMGEDMWMVLCIRSDEEWQRFCGVTGHPEWGEDPRFLTHQTRHLHHDKLDKLISSWTVRYDHNEVTAILQASGIPAAPVLANWEMLSNLHIAERGFYVQIAHREMGQFPYPGMPWKLSETPGVVRMPAPLFGEHNGLIFKDLLKVETNELQTLYQQRIIADHPPEDLPAPRRLLVHIMTECSKIASCI